MLTKKALRISDLFTTAWTPLGLFLYSLVAYGLLIPFLGFYWDDWQAVWWNHTFGIGGFIDYFSGDRPFLAGIYILTNAILNETPLAWQIAVLFSRWLTAVLVWWTLRQIWPDHEEQVAWISILFLLYPGFKQQPIAIVWTNGLLLFTAQIASLGLMIKAVKDKKRYWLFTIIALFSSALCNFSTEYFVGLEFIRPAFLWLILPKSNPQILRFKQTALYWLPFIALLGLWGFWRVFIFGFPTYHPGLADTVQTQSGILFQIFKIPSNIFSSGWLAWLESYRFPSINDLDSLTNRLYWIIVILCLLLTLLYLFKLNRKDKDAQIISPNLGFAKEAISIGALSLCVSGLPFWVANLPIENQYPYDRFTLAFILGSVLIIVGMLEWVVRMRLQKVIILSSFICMAIGAHFLNSNSYRRDWETQKSFFWQMTWRIPALKPGTIILTRNLPLNYYTDNSLTAPLNWIYAPENKSHNLPYFLADMEVRLGRSLPKQKNLENNIPVTQLYRTAVYQGNTSQILMIFYSPPGCLRILDPARDNDLFIMPREMEETMYISHPDQVILDSAYHTTPPLIIFGPEPPHDWCYYFESADLARQRSDWQRVVELSDQAYERGLFPTDKSETIIFIESYYYTGDWARALELMLETYSIQPSLHTKLCKILAQFQDAQAPNEAAISALVDTREDMDCETK